MRMNREIWIEQPKKSYWEKNEKYFLFFSENSLFFNGGMTKIIKIIEKKRVIE